MQATCKSCQHVFGVRLTAHKQKIACPQCKTVFKIPPAPPTGGTDRDKSAVTVEAIADDQKHLLQALLGEIKYQTKLLRNISLILTVVFVVWILVVCGGILSLGGGIDPLL